MTTRDPLYPDAVAAALADAPPVDAEQARAVRALLAPFSPPFYGDTEHQPAIFQSPTRSTRESRVCCTCGEELGTVAIDAGMQPVRDLHDRHLVEIGVA